MASPSTWHLLLGTGLLFGLGLPLSQLGARHGIDAAAFALWPTAVAALGLAVLGWIRHGPVPLGTRVLRFGLIAGTLGHAVPVSAAYWLAGKAGAGFAALAYTMPPVMTLALSLMLRLERPALARIGAVALGLAGALLLATGRAGAFEPGAVAIAALLLIALSIAGANVYRALHLPGAVPAEWLAALMLASSAAVLAATRGWHGSFALPLQADALLWPALQAAAVMAGYLLFFTLQRRAGPVVLSFVGTVSMATGLAVAAIGFGEAVPAALAPALALIGASMWLLRRPSGDAAPDAAPTASRADAQDAHCADTCGACALPACG